MTEDVLIENYLKALVKSPFKGEVSCQEDSKTLYKTDNSVYQLNPLAVIFPFDSSDIDYVYKVANQFPAITFMARGGGTGTNGQSLNRSIIIDFSKHMTRIKSIDVKNKTVCLEPGVVLDQLNEYLVKYDLFFPPTVSPSNRATIGGMIGTDASGKGSYVYGKTSDYIVSLDVLMTDNKKYKITALTANETKNIAKDKSLIGTLYKKVIEISNEHSDEISKTFTNLSRGLTGYNIKKAYDIKTKDSNLCYLFAGSEGSLGLVKEIVLKVIAKPKYSCLVIAHYNDFIESLKDVPSLLKFSPLAIETVDNAVINLAKTSSLWDEFSHNLPQADSANIQAFHLIEFISDNQQELRRLPLQTIEYLKTNNCGGHLIEEPRTISNMWNLRKQFAALMGKTGKDFHQGLAFIEDTLVPPENLASYMTEFKNILDSYAKHELIDGYGIYGHADVGCMHVRPFMNLNEVNTIKTIRSLSEKILDLVKKYNGLFWGEHGKGVRGIYAKDVFPAKLYQSMREIKTICDKDNKLNPNKIFTSLIGKQELFDIDEIPTRGDYNRKIKPDLLNTFKKALDCNGNGACFDYKLSTLMCPSYKATRDRRYSPKGRAELIRQWAYLSSLPNKQKEADIFSHEVYKSLSLCLSCKACTSACPSQVDIPSLKAKFLANYHKQNKRSLTDILVSHSEIIIKKVANLPYFIRLVLHNKLTNLLIENIFQLKDLPLLPSKPLPKLLKDYQLPVASLEYLNNLPKDKLKNTVILSPDFYTAYYHSEIISDHISVLNKLSKNICIMPDYLQGKAMHSIGDLNKFKLVANNVLETFKPFKQFNLPIITTDYAFASMFNHEYPSTAGNESDYPNVMIINNYLVSQIDKIGKIGNSLAQKTNESFKIFLHCSEQSLYEKSGKDWQTVFSSLNIKTKIIATSCCGMAGVFGHEKKKQAISKKIYQQSWMDSIDNKSLVTGFSCRCQVKRISNIEPLHPITLVDKHLTNLKEANN